MCYFAKYLTLLLLYPLIISIGLSSCQDITEVTCQTRGIDPPLGQSSAVSFEVNCPAYCSNSVGNVWGDVIYTDDSSICRAAIHDGIITESTGGKVRFFFTDGQNSYRGVLRNSVQSSSYGSWQKSIKFTPDAVDVTCQTRGYDQPFADLNYPLFLVNCPSSCSHSVGNVWGDVIYTDDSSICRAAIHDGKITDSAGGQVSFRFADGQNAYNGVLKNSIRSFSYGPWRRSMTFSSSGTETGPPSAHTTCSTNAQEERFASKSDFTVNCPSGCDGLIVRLYVIYGDIVYSDDSSICQAAIHDGRITTDSGGSVRVYKRGTEQSFPGKTRNSITSRSRISSAESISFVNEIFTATCETTGQDALFVGLTEYVVRCPVNCQKDFSPVWGDIVYTQSSSVCRSAVHNSQINPAEGGFVRVYTYPGQHYCPERTSEYIPSSPHGPYAGSFAFNSSIRTTPDVTCNTKARDSSFAKSRETMFDVFCPSSCVDSSGIVWGNIVYTENSSICRAAIHDGKVTDSGGRVRFYKYKGQNSYASVLRNSVQSTAQEAFANSIAFIPPYHLATLPPHIG
ncbi:unnamed protein product [Clavelina lepadiformis]|uniref:LCCL domain-containing protein n=1 Tax=Clavelina lepadiformis TaxID=159417 RepID=A0ABP0FZ89_CLALP